MHSTHQSTKMMEIIMKNNTYTMHEKMHDKFPVISFSTNVYNNPADILGSIKDLARHFDAVEFEIGEEAEKKFWSLSELERLSLAKEIKSFCIKENIFFSVHAGWWGRQYNLCANSLNERKMAIGNLIHAIEFARESGAYSVTFHPGYKDGHENQQLLKYLIENINDVKKGCTLSGIDLCLENMGEERPKYALLSIHEHILFHEKTQCAITVDITHLCSIYPYGNKLFNAISELSPITRHLHIADLKGTHHQHLPISEGNLPLSDILNKFSYSGYRGVAVIEEFIPQFSTEFYLEKGIEYKKRIQAMRDAIK